METSEQDLQLQIVISGKLAIDGPLADYTQLLNGVCTLIAMDLDRQGNKRTQYLIAHLLCDYVKVNLCVFPSRYMLDNSYEYNGLLTNSSNLYCTVRVKKYTEHAYEEINKFSEMPCHRINTIKYFVDDNTLVKITYDLTIDIGVFPESNLKYLQSQRFCTVLRLKIDKDLIECLKYLCTRSCSKPFDLKKMGSFLAEHIKTLGGKELFMSPPILDRLYAELESEQNIDLPE